MNKLTSSMIVLLAAFFVHDNIQAAPMLYTFEGTVTTVSHDNAGAIANAGLSVGSIVSYTFIIDLDAAASETHFGGYVDYDSYVDTSSWDYFFVDYISGDALAEVGGGFYNTVGPADGSGPMDASEKNWGYNTLIGGAGGFLHTNSDDNQLQLKNIGTNVSDWVVGTKVHADNWAFDSQNRQSQLFATLSLKSISPANAIPEPSMIFMFVAGLFGLGVARRRLADH